MTRTSSTRSTSLSRRLLNASTAGVPQILGAGFLDQRARIIARLGRNKEAEPLFKEALDITKSAAPGRDSIDAAEKYLSEALALRKKNLPEGHWLVASSESVLGAHFTLAHRYREAENLLLPAERKLVEIRGEDAPVVGDARGQAKIKTLPPPAL